MNHCWHRIDWLRELCPEIADWQAELIAAEAQRRVETERENIARMFDGAVWSYDYREIAAAIRARGKND